MFDVRPTQRDGSLDMSKVKSVHRTVRIEPKKSRRLAGSQKFVPVTDVKTVSRRISNAANSQETVSRTNYANSPANFPDLEQKYPKNTPDIRVDQISDFDSYDSYRPEEFSANQAPHQAYAQQKVADHSIGHTPNSRNQLSAGYYWEGDREFQPSKRKKIAHAKNYFKAVKRLCKIILYLPALIIGYLGKSILAFAGHAKSLKLFFRPKRKHFKIPDFSGLELTFRQKFRTALSFALVLLFFSSLAPALGLVQKGIEAKSKITADSLMALGHFASAKDELSQNNFNQAAVNFDDSYKILSEANSEISQIGGNFSELLRFVPGLSKVASAKYIISAGENIATAGKNLSRVVSSVNNIGNPLSENGQADLSGLFLGLKDGIADASSQLKEAENNINKVGVDDLPAEIRDNFVTAKEKLAVVNSTLDNFNQYSQIFLDVLGYNGPRKYLFLFQNNQEMRATGGFIGSYGILDISQGSIKNLFVDGIYNPDGQLKARVIPPEPIQKMSAVWTMHDANWFPDFPTSAEKIAWFYEKTGGPTVDGIITLTPTVIQNLLEVTGPIEMPEYDTTVSKENFIEKTQNEVEVDYDKELNQPKQFIADLTPKILDRVFSLKGLDKNVKVLGILSRALKEKQILLYSKNYNVQKLISDQNWSGEILNADRDYLSVINTNINGYKTDGVIDETISHQSDVQNDGSIVDTVTITRKHNGGNEEYEWWNKVNADYMRVYVPEGSKLLEASGQTREIVSPPLDYKTLDFKRDPQVEQENQDAKIDEESGTKIYQDKNKSVFANWVYVSPGESATVTYKYLLPFRLEFDSLHHPADSFSVLYQKQSGSPGSKLISNIMLPEKYAAIWKWPDNLAKNGQSYTMETTLDVDKVVGLAIEKNQ
ncbi:MAG: DUF4012 domain-containing protein [Parcubacteria group bacterium]